MVWRVSGKEELVGLLRAGVSMQDHALFPAAFKCQAAPPQVKRLFGLGPGILRGPEHLCPCSLFGHHVGLKAYT